MSRSCLLRTNKRMVHFADKQQKKINVTCMCGIPNGGMFMQVPSDH